MTLTNNIYPGMVDTQGEVEFFTYLGGVKAIQNGKIKDFTELHFGIIQLLEEEIEANKKVKMALLDWHPTSKYARLEQFTKCRFGGLDFKADIKKGVLQKGEYWNCLQRENCINNGIICNPPMFNGVTLSPLDIKLMKLMATSYTNEVIAEMLQLPLGSFHKYKKALYSKLGNVQTKQEVALIAKSLNFI